MLAADVFPNRVRFIRPSPPVSPSSSSLLVLCVRLLDEE
jgi:hypothetical protein